MKLIFLIVLLILFVVLAILVYLKYYYKHIVYKDMVYLCKMLKNNISFNKNTIDELLSTAEKRVSSLTKNILYDKLSNRKSYILTKEELLVFEGFIKSLGRGDVSYEINNINYYEGEFLDKKTTTKELLDKDGKMYLKLIIGVGLAIFIILI